MAGVVVRRRWRPALGRNRIFRDRTNPFDLYDDNEFYEKFRFRRPDFLDIVDDVRDNIEYPMPRKGSLSAILQLMITLRFYATGCFQNLVADTVGVNQSTVSRTISRVTDALLLYFRQWVCLPSQQEAEELKRMFFEMAGFPNVIGCIDGTHVRIQAPTVNEHEYVNRKNHHSINVQIMCDADLKIINCVAKWPGSVHDSRILRESYLFEIFESQDKPLAGFILGDSGYMLRDWLMTPFINPRNPQEQLYNDSHCTTRNSVERCIGVLKRRWHCLHTELRLKPIKVCKVVCVCAGLHNRAVELRLPVPVGDNDLQPYADQALNYHQIQRHGNEAGERARAASGKQARDCLVQQVFLPSL